MVQNLEAVAFNDVNYYDCLHYMTNGGKLLKTQAGLKWATLTKTRPTANIKIRIRPKTKRMVPYSFFGLLVYVPVSGNYQQLMSIADTTDITHMYAGITVRYNEWHQDFDFRRA